MKFEVTLKQLRDHDSCVEGYNKVVCMLKGIEFGEYKKTHIRFNHSAPISLVDIANNNGIDDALWCLRCNPEWERDSRLFAVWCARQVQHLMKDERSIHSLDVAEKHADGNATDEELTAAWAAARAADTAAAMAAATAAAWAADTAAQKEMFIKMCKGEAPWQIGASVSKGRNKARAM